MSFLRNLSQTPNGEQESKSIKDSVNPCEFVSNNRTGQFEVSKKLPADYANSPCFPLLVSHSRDSILFVSAQRKLCNFLEMAEQYGS